MDSGDIPVFKYLTIFANLIILRAGTIFSLLNRPNHAFRDRQCFETGWPRWPPWSRDWSAVGVTVKGEPHLYYSQNHAFEYWTRILNRGRIISWLYSITYKEILTTEQYWGYFELIGILFLKIHPVFSEKIASKHSKHADHNIGL